MAAHFFLLLPSVLYVSGVSTLSTTRSLSLEVVCRHKVQADPQLYSRLMAVAGQSKRLDLAFDLQADMQAAGQLPTQVTLNQPGVLVM